jgi:glutamine amidotransferase
MRVALLDYGTGNVHSLRKALARTGATVTVTTTFSDTQRADLLVLPGVGAFGQAADRLAAERDALRAAARDGLPMLGICLGMQLLFDRSDEGDGAGLGIIPGSVTRVGASRLPHIGWNALVDARDAALATSGLRVPYYANSFACRPTDPTLVSAWCRHEQDRFPAIVRAGTVVGVQFHPEKSGEPGVAFLAALVREASCS